MIDTLLWVIGGIIVGLIVVKVVKHIHFKLTVKKMLDGDYGKEARWFVEYIVEEDDETVANAVRELSKMDIREIQILAEDKDHLKELLLERMEERGKV